MKQVETKKMKHFDLTDSEFERNFENCRLDPSIFNHEAHLRLAWIHIYKYGLEKAIDNITSQLKQFTTKIGASHKFNKTLSVASIYVVHHFMKKSDADNFKEFISENPKLRYAFKDLLECHYQIDIFNSETAKTKYIEPDLLPF